MTIQQIVDGLLGQWGTLFLCLVILWSGYKRYWVWGWYATELKQRNEKTEKRLEDVLYAADNATGFAQKATSMAESTMSTGA